MVLDKATRKIKKTSPTSNSIVNSLNQKDGKIWVASYSEGLFELDEDLNILKHFHENGQGPLKLVNNSVRSVTIDSSGLVWIGTFLGLHIYNPSENTLIHHYPEKDNLKGLSHQSIWEIVEDHQKSVWIATYYGGVNYTDKSQSLFKSYLDKSTANSEVGKFVLGEILEDEDQNLWIATEGNGLKFYDKKKDQLINYDWFNHPEFNGKNIKSLWLEKSGTLYIGTHEGDYSS
ncbi:ligand-binding sensor domain-containing protein [Algoriphagus boritolerans]|uniref:ligand-binding sensor domain-containing protein n=1 Tax=Algoriphagus boritolerans TaxID=308111 RepID=UPI000B104AE7